MSGDARNERESKTLRAWLLALLRFAVTLDEADRLAILSISAEIDNFSLHHNGRPTFGFFRKTSAELCEAILRPNESNSAILHRHFVARIDDDRLKRAFMAVIEIDKSKAQIVSKSIKRNDGLWRGLPARGKLP